MPNPHGRNPEREEPKKRAQIMLTPTAKAILKKADNPIRQAGWRSVSALVEAMLRGEVEVPKQKL
ncbi:MAG: hypothetical protein AAFV85_23195 [Cyanobacteria bacterium J06634_6]